jgi:hypothetical protein
MFDSIIYKNETGHGQILDIGALAEGLLFYGKVAIVGNTATIKDLLVRIPPLILLSLLRDKRIELYYLSDQIGVSSVPMSNGRSLYSLINFSSPDHTIEKIGAKSFKEATNGNKFAASQFAKLLHPLSHNEFDQESILQALSDNVSTEASVEALMKSVVPDYKPAYATRFKIERQYKGGFHVDTNIDFNQVNDAYHKIVPASHSAITEAYIVALLQSAYESTYFAGMLNSEIAVTPIERVIQAKAVEAIVHRHDHSASQIESFVDLTLANGHAIREAINSGAVPFASVVKLLESADPFRHWLREQSTDIRLLNAYYEEVTKGSWVEKLPAKSLRWSVFTGLGLSADFLGAGGFGTAISTTIGAVDTFLLDKLIKGWKPHQFIENDFKPVFKKRKSHT